MKITTYTSLILLRIFMLSAFLIVSSGTIAQEKNDDSINRDLIISAAREIMGMQKYCALITVDSSGQPHVRTMNPYSPDEDMIVWMATSSLSRKVKEIQNNPNVCLYYADHNYAYGYVAINGKAVLVNDMDEKLKRKRDYWDQSFPDWNNLILIKVIPEKLDVLNYRKGMHNDSITWRTPSIDFEQK